jgi:adenylosuccinate synthase
MHAKVVIGANYGDEGKGLVTDFLARRHNVDCVVRFNGGAQAGHTVCTPQHRHVFHHLGSATLVGVPTYLSRFFICNPYIFHKEWQQLRMLGAHPEVTVHPLALVTTPYDMLLNQLAEGLRGDARHGSVGLGIGETVERSERFEDLTAGTVLSKPRSYLYTLLTTRMHKWACTRGGELCAQYAAGPWSAQVLIEHPAVVAFESMLRSEEMVNDWLDWVDTFRDNVRPAEQPATTGLLLFEGAQGLGLDQNNQASFPHVTRSNTGVRNVVHLLHEFNKLSQSALTDIDVTYVTRTYLTRHGAGPLPGELPQAPRGVEDETNIPHRWQGSLRFAKHDLQALRTRIASDVVRMTYGAAFSVPIRYGLAVTCCDQYTAGPSLKEFAEATSLDVTLASYGPTYRDVRPGKQIE